MWQRPAPVSEGVRIGPLYALANVVTASRILQMHDGDILGHEFMGIVDEVGPEVKNFKKGGAYFVKIHGQASDTS